MSEQQFQREHRYFVFKVKNLTQEQQQRLYDFEMELGPYNSVGECVVVEADWPNYQDTWDAIQAITEKRYISRGHLQTDCAEWRARAIKAEDECDALTIEVDEANERVAAANEQRDALATSLRSITDAFECGDQDDVMQAVGRVIDQRIVQGGAE